MQQPNNKMELSIDPPINNPGKPQTTKGAPETITVQSSNESNTKKQNFENDQRMFQKLDFPDPKCEFT